MTRPWGPSRPKGGGGQKVIKPVKPPPPSSGEKKGWWPCSIVIAVPALTLLAACAVVTLHGP